MNHLNSNPDALQQAASVWQHSLVRLLGDVEEWVMWYHSKYQSSDMYQTF